MPCSFEHCSLILQLKDWNWRIWYSTRQNKDIGHGQNQLGLASLNTWSTAGMSTLLHCRVQHYLIPIIALTQSIENDSKHTGTVLV